MVRAFLNDTILPMNILTIIHRADGVNIHGKNVQRTAGRRSGIIHAIGHWLHRMEREWLVIK
jgi:hypothetical protein